MEKIDCRNIRVYLKAQNRIVVLVEHVNIGTVPVAGRRVDCDRLWILLTCVECHLITSRAKGVTATVDVANLWRQITVTIANGLISWAQ
jgi:hypothetical protein